MFYSRAKGGVEAEREERRRMREEKVKKEKERIASFRKLQEDARRRRAERMHKEEEEAKKRVEESQPTMYTHQRMLPSSGIFESIEEAYNGSDKEQNVELCEEVIDDLLNELGPKHLFNWEWQDWSACQF